MMEDKTTIMLDPRRNQTRERKKLFEEMLLKEIPGTSRANEPMHAVLEGELAESELLEGKESQNVRNRALIHYLATLANSNSTNDRFDFSFVQSLLNNGADVNSTDKTGQTVFHEVARSWNIDVATFLIRNGANVNQQDQYGRSPLHVAAAVDYAEMVEFLLENEADIDIQTSEEGQAPIHFAAKNDAINSLQMLLGYGANIDARDSKNRTPLQVSAEMNRSKAAKLLIAEGAPAGVYDNLGNSALSLLIEKIPEVALDAMDQFHSVDTINRKEFYFLNYLESTKLKEEKTPARTPLEIAVQNERFDIIMHPVMQRLITVKWQMYGKWGAVFDLVLNLVYTILWTVLAVTLPNNGRDLYLPLGKNSWRLVIGILLILFTMREIRKQIVNTMKTRQELKKWREWRAAELERDLAYCHPRWPQEAQYLRAEIKAVRNLSLISGSDWWIYFDWAALVLILATISSHVTFFHYSNDTSKEVHHYIIIPLLLILWLRIFKYARPFESAGPFVVIFGHVLGDIVKWGFLNSIIVIPFTCAFWITFGSISLTPVDGYDNVGPLLYNVFSMMVVNDHNYKKLEKVNPIMARLLCGSFIAIAAIVTINLLIALLSNTFERLYENAVANAVMQRARTILLLQKSLRRKAKKKYYDFIKINGSPEVIVKTLGRLLMMDGDDRATIERVRDDVKVIVNILGEKFGRKFGKGKKSDLDFVKMDVSKVRRFQEELMVDVKNMKQALQEITEKVEKITTNNERDMKQAFQEITEKVEEITANNGRDMNQAFQDITEIKINTTPSTVVTSPKLGKAHERSEEHPNDSETELSDSEFDNESNSTSNRQAKLTKLKTSEQDDHGEQTEKSSKSKSASLLSRKTTGVGDENPGIIHQQLSYRRQATSQISNHHADFQNKHDPRNIGTSSGSKNAHDQVLYGNNQWLGTTPNRRGHPQHHQTINNPGFQRRQHLGHRPDYGEIAPNFNQRSSPYYDMRYPEKQYFDTSCFNTPVYSPPVENMTSLRSSSYVGQPLITNRFQPPPAMQNFQNVYGYQNYGFQATDEDFNESMSSGYKPFVPNTPVFTHDEYKQPGRASHPAMLSMSREPVGLQYAPTTAQVTQDNINKRQQLPYPILGHLENDSAFQKHDIQGSSLPGTVQTPSSSIAGSINSNQGHQSQTTDDLLESHDEITKHQTTTIASEILNKVAFFEKKIDNNQRKKSTANEELDEIKVTKEIEETRRISIPMSQVSEHSPLVIENEAPGDSIKEVTNKQDSEDIVSEAPKADTSQHIVQEINVSQNETLGAGQLMAPSYETYPPSTPIAKEIVNKVAFFEGKMDNNQWKSTANEELNEIKVIKEIEETRCISIPPFEIAEHSPLVIENDAPGDSLKEITNKQSPNIFFATLEITPDNTKVPTINPTAELHSATDDPSKTEEYRTDESTSSEESFSLQPREPAELRDMPLSSEDLQVKVENETPEEISSENSEENFPDIVLSPLVEKKSRQVQD